MKIGVLADTHDRLESLLRVKEIFVKEKVEMIIHCGDWVSPSTIEFFDQTFHDFQLPVKSVLGNNEGDIKRILERNAQLLNPIEFASKQVLELTVENRTIAVYHGQDKIILEVLILSKKYDAIFTGHTHIVRQELIGGTYVLNPGSTNFEANSKIIDRASVAIYDTKLNQAEVFYFDQVK